MSGRDNWQLYRETEHCFTEMGPAGAAKDANVFQKRHASIPWDRAELEKPVEEQKGCTWDEGDIGVLKTADEVRAIQTGLASVEAAAVDAERKKEFPAVDEEKALGVAELQARYDAVEKEHALEKARIETGKQHFVDSAAAAADAEGQDAMQEPRLDPERTVYLTADSPNVIWDLRPGDTYVIGGIVDRNRVKNATIQKARHYRMRTARLPISEVIDGLSSDSKKKESEGAEDGQKSAKIAKTEAEAPEPEVAVNSGTKTAADGSGSNPGNPWANQALLKDFSKVLTVNQVVSILLHYQACGDWAGAFARALPDRKRTSRD